MSQLPTWEQSQADRLRAAVDRRDRLLDEALDEVERLRDELGRQYAKINAVWDLMQQTPFSQDIAKADLVNALVEGGNPT